MESKVAELPLSHKALAWFEKNRKQALWGTAIIAAVALVAWFFLAQRAERQAQASRALSDVNLAQSGFGAPAQESPEPFLKVVSQYPNSEAAPRALLLAAGAYFSHGKYTEAEAQFQRFLRDYRDNSLVGQALLGVAACLEAQGKTEPAIAAYKDLVTRHPTDPVVPQAKFALGRLYEAQNKPELARDNFLQAEQESRFSSMGNEAGMRYEEIIQKYPNLAPPPTPAPAPFSLTPTPANPNISTSGPAALKPTGTNNPAPAKK